MTEQNDAVLRGCRLLIVEDDYLLAIELARGLEENGAEIAGMAGSIEDAVALIEQEGDRLNGAVLDINLGDERVYPVADMLISRRLPFVFATGYDLWVIPEIYAGIPRCEKPIRASVLARLLAEQMAH
jgi:ActR/RegA family two-component response regulator